MDKKFVILAVSLMVAANPVLAQDLSPVVNTLQSVVDAITGPIGRAIAIIGAVIIGTMMMFGRVQVATFLLYLGGCALVFGAAAFVDGFATP